MLKHPDVFFIKSDQKNRPTRYFDFTCLTYSSKVGPYLQYFQIEYMMYLRISIIDTK